MKRLAQLGLLMVSLLVSLSSQSQMFQQGQTTVSNTTTEYTDPESYSQLYVRNMATTGTEMQTQIAVCGYDGAGNSCHTWFGRTGPTFTYGPYPDIGVVENDKNGIGIFADGPNGTIKSFTGGYRTNDYLRMTIHKNGETTFGTHGELPVDPAALNVQALGQHPNLYLLDQSGLFLVSHQVTSLGSYIFTSYEQGGYETPIYMGTFSHRLNQLTLSTNGGVGINNSNPDPNTLDVGNIRIRGNIICDLGCGTTTSGVTGGETTPPSDYIGPTTQTVATASRSLGTVYQNNTGRALFVSATVQSNSGSASIIVQSDVAANSMAYVAFQFLPSPNNAQSVFFVVPPGNYYKVWVNVGTGSITIWSEWN